MVRLRASLVALGLTWLALDGCQSPPPTKAQCTTGQFSLTASFDGGVMGECTVIDTSHVELALAPEDEPINPSPWYSFQVSGNGTLTIELDYGAHIHRYPPKISRDGHAWRTLGPITGNPGHRYRFTVEVDGRLLVSAQENHTTQWYDDWAAGLLERYPGIERTRIGHSAEGRPLWAFATRHGAPNTVLLVGRQHPPEVSGAIAMRHFVERLLTHLPTDSDGCLDAPCRFHKETNVVFVPLVNPDGVNRGHWRHNLRGIDINRDWGPFTQPETRAIEALIDRLAETSIVRGFLDFHSTNRNVFYIQAPGFRTSPADFGDTWLAHARERGVYEFEPAPRYTTTLATAKNYMHKRFGVPAITYELGDETNRAAIRQSSNHFADTFVETLYPYGPLYDVVIKGGRIVDGSGAEPFTGDLAIRGDRIVRVERSGAAQMEDAAGEVIDATGLVVSPGFIDPHTHTQDDLADTERALNEPYLRQGVTTVFIGNDGGGLPYLEQVDALDAEGLGTHVGLWVGHGLLRERVVGTKDRPATTGELDTMAQLVTASVEAGALGLSTGLFYAPGSYADTEEVTVLARAAAVAGGRYDSHIRDESDYTMGLQAAVDEVIRIATDAQVPAHIAHIKTLGASVHGQAAAIIEKIATARSNGAAITADQYPWLASGTRLSNALLPRWVQSGGRERMLAQLTGVREGDELFQAMAVNLKRRGGAAKLVVSGVSALRGKTLADIALDAGQHPLFAAIDIIREGDPAVASFVMIEADVEAFMRQPWVMTGSDGSQGHPRKYGSFPRKFRKYVRDKGILTLPEFVHRSTQLTARTFGLCDRGRLAPGYVADIAVWDPETYRSRATYERPAEYADGVVHLWVSGTPTLRNGALTGVNGGYPLRREDCGSE